MKCGLEFPCLFFAKSSDIHLQITLYSMFVAVMAFFARISDPAVGGTYMTLLNTVSNLGGNWPSTVVLWLVDVLTWGRCNIPDTQTDNMCASQEEKDVKFLRFASPGIFSQFPDEFLAGLQIRWREV